MCNRKLQKISVWKNKIILNKNLIFTSNKDRDFWCLAAPWHFLYKPCSLHHSVDAPKGCVATKWRPYNFVVPAKRNIQVWVKVVHMWRLCVLHCGIVCQNPPKHFYSESWNKCIDQQEAILNCLHSKLFNFF